MDKFAEQLVKKTNSTKDDMKRACIIIVAVTVTLVSLLLIVMGMTVAILLPVGVGFGAWYFLKMMYTEYEYSCTNGTLDITKILGQSKRKELLSIEVRNFTAYGKVGDCPEEQKEDSSMTIFSAMGVSMMREDDDTEEYYAEFPHPEYGKCCLYFNPNSSFREALEPFLSREVKLKSSRQL